VSSHERVFPSRALLLLWIGAALGLVLALTSLAFPAKAPFKDALSPGVVAMVNGQPILKGDYDVALRTIAELQRHPLTDRDRHAAIDRAIDDELLIEYGLELGMARDDPTTRQALLSAAITAVREQYSGKAADEAFAAKLAELRKAARIREAPVLP
jgi:hypothetical protein